MTSFRRNARLTLYQARPGSFTTYLADSLVIEELRMQFAIELQLGGDPNTCDVTITNLADDSRAFLQRRGVHAILDAGHDGEYHQLFRGDLRHALPTRTATERDMLLQLGDGARAYRYARVARSFRDGTPIRDLIREAAAAMQLPLAVDVLTRQEFDARLVLGDVIQGPARDELTRLLAPLGYSWSIQRGALQIVNQTDVRSNERLVFDTADPDSGVIGSPQLRPGKLGSGKTTLTLQSLLRPDVVPGARIQVSSGDVNGTFRAERVRHTGDTHGEDWTTEIEAKPL